MKPIKDPEPLPSRLVMADNRTSNEIKFGPVFRLQAAGSLRAMNGSAHLG